MRELGQIPGNTPGREEAVPKWSWAFPVLGKRVVGPPGEECWSSSSPCGEMGRNRCDVEPAGGSEVGAVA